MHVFFDLDNTLWDFDANSKETLSELFDEFSLDGLTGVTKEYFIQRYFFQNDRYWDLYRQNRVSKARLRSIRFEVTLRDIGIDNKSLARQVGKAYLEQCPLKSNLIEGAEEVIKALHGSHQLHVLSNGFQDTQILKLKSCSMHSYFDHVITSERECSKATTENV
jgi:putative hydrolase of the HAD superfamily